MPRHRTMRLACALLIAHAAARPQPRAKPLALKPVTGRAAAKLDEERLAEENLKNKATKTGQGDCVAARVRHKKVSERSRDEKKRPTS